MQINRLELQAIGPFTNKHVIDFQQIQHEKGLFLINGDTGSGKTTLLDAIVFALYNQVTSSENNGEEKLRCAYAAPDTKSYVCLDFESGNATYRIIRSPKYLRPKKRGEGLVEQPSQVSLFQLDENGAVSAGALATKAVQVGEELARILPLNKDQFLQTVILPQGDFARFLHADTKNRKQILEKIFKTDIYSRIEKLLAEKSRQIQQDFSQKNQASQQLLQIFLQSVRKLEHEQSQSILEKIASELEQIPPVLIKEQSQVVKAHFPLLEALFQEQQQGYQQEAFALETQLNQQKEHYYSRGQSQKQLQEYQNHLDRFLALTQKSPQFETIKEKVSLFEQGKPLNSLYPQLVKAKQVLQKTHYAYLELAAPARSRNANNPAEAAVAAPSASAIFSGDTNRNLLAQITQLRQENEQLTTQIQTVQAQLKQLEDLTSLRRRLQKNRAAFSPAQGDLESAQKHFLALDRLLLHLRQRQNQQEKLQKEQRRLLKILDLHQEYRQFQARIKAQQDKRQHLLQDIADTAAQVEQAQAHYQQVESAYQADALATLLPLLTPDSPCPLCGSPEHPHPAQASPSQTSLADLHAATAQQARLREALQAQRERLAALEAEITQAKLAHSSPPYIEISPALEWQVAQLAGQIQAYSTSACAQLPFPLPGEAESVLLAQPSLAEAINSIEKLQLQAHSALLNARSQLLDLVKDNNSLKEQLSHFPGAPDLDSAALASLQEQLFVLKQAKAAKLAEIDRSEALNLAFLSCQQQEKQFQELLNAQNFTSEAAYLASQSEAGQMPKLKAALENYQQERERLTTLLHNQAALLPASLQKLPSSPELSQQLQDFLTELSQQLQEESTVLKQLSQHQQNAQARLHTWENQVKTASENYQSWQEALKTSEDFYRSHQPLLELAGAAVASSQNAQSLSSWVLVDRFHEVLSYANPYLAHISAGRYQLRPASTDHSRKADQALSLVVFDGHSDQERAVASLSGGESFYCSLSLALGLAEAVTAQAGGITLGTMFIDEGFGTLDEEKREAVLHALTETSHSGRKIGLISHIDSLKDTLSEQIVVKSLVKSRPVLASAECKAEGKGSYLYCTWDS